MKIGIPVYDKVDVLDVYGPFEMFDWAGYDIDLPAAEPGMKRFRSKGFPYSVTFPERFPKVKHAPGNPRFVLDRDRLTGGGVSSGLDTALKLMPPARG